jgi:hypothetical protein
VDNRHVVHVPVGTEFFAGGKRIWVSQLSLADQEALHRRHDGDLEWRKARGLAPAQRRPLSPNQGSTGQAPPGL